MSNRFIVVAVAAACVAAAGTGGYLAMRQNVTPAPVSAAAPAAPATASPAAPPISPATAESASKPVQETEGIVGDTTKADPAPASSEPKQAAPLPKRADRTARPVTRAARAETRQAPTLDRSWPASAAQEPPPPTPQTAAPGTLIPSDGSSLPGRDAQEPPRPVEPEKTFQELVVPAESVVGLQTETPLSSERSRVEDRVEAHVTRDVRVGDRVAIPAGARALGTVSLVERGGKFKERARLGVRFHTIVLADGTRLPISTDMLFRDGEAPGGDASKKIGGGAAVGAILGAIIGGGKGAAIGAAAGGGAGSAAVMAGDRSAATLPSGSPVTVRLLAPVTVTVEK